jgi:hypothetical protein
VHDTGNGGALVPEGFGRFRRVADLGEFLRLLHVQRLAHRETGEPYTISQEVAGDAASFDRVPVVG